MAASCSDGWVTLSVLWLIGLTRPQRSHLLRLSSPLLRDSSSPPPESPPASSSSAALLFPLFFSLSSPTTATVRIRVPVFPVGSSSCGCRRAEAGLALLGQLVWVAPGLPAEREVDGRGTGGAGSSGGGGKGWSDWCVCRKWRENERELLGRLSGC